MQLGNIATPQEESTPELRYASLHRAVERGMASQDVFRELAEICLQLGHFDEAMRVHEGMEPGPLRDHVASRLRRRGLLGGAPSTQSSADAPRGASARGPDESTSASEHALDAVHYLAQGSMPVVALSTMLAFPIVVSAGGMLTGGSQWLFAALAAPPAFCVLGLVGAMARKVHLQSADGESEPPAVPGASELLALGKRFFADHAAVLGVYVVPALTALLLGVPAMSMLPALLLGMFLVPMALLLRQLRGDWGALSPVTIMRGISCARGYSKLAGLFWLAFAPSAIAFWATLGHTPWMQLAIVGPLAVLPTLGTARVLGTFFDSRRELLGKLTIGVQQPSGPEAAAPVSPQRKPMRGERPVGPAPRAARPAAATQPAPRPAAPAAQIEGRAPKPVAQRQATRTTQQRVAAQQAAPAQRQAARPQPAEQRHAAQATPAVPTARKEFSGPDLSGIPGATVISAADRERMGAAARRV